MKLLRSLVIVAAVGLAVAASAGTASAFGKPCAGPGCGHGHAVPAPSTLFAGGLFNKKLPAFQAAPWYQYWPYDAHFLTPAPISGAFYGPPLTGNFPVNPYFPGPAYGQFGPIPGGPAPGGVIPPPPAGLPSLPR